MDSVIRAFGADHVERLTGLSTDQLRRWDDEGFFAPSLAFENRRAPHSRIYSFKDVVGLRVLNILRTEYGVSFQHLRKVEQELRAISETPWSDVTLYVLNREVYFDEPQSGRVRGVVNKQFVADLPLASVIEDMQRKAEKLRERSPTQIGAVERHRFVAHNSWVIAGTRIPVAAIRHFAEAGYSATQIIAEYPTLTISDVQAALAQADPLTQVA